MSRLILGIQPVREAIKVLGGSIERVFIQGEGGPKLEALARYAETRGIGIERLPRNELDRRSSGGRHQGVLAMGPELKLWSIDTLTVNASSVVVALDGVMDPQNFGAIVRTSVALGACAIVWPEHSSAPLSPATFRASAGAIEHAVLCRVGSLPEALARLAARGVTPIALDARGPMELGELDLHGPVALVIGSEDKGARRPVRLACKHVARLPMRGPIASLNASVAAGIALYEIVRQRQDTSPIAAVPEGECD